MVRFAVPKIPATRKQPLSGRAGTRLSNQQFEFKRTRNAPERPIRLPSLYPTISLNALNSSSQGSEQVLHGNRDCPNVSFENCSHASLVSGINGEKQTEKHVNNRVKVKESEHKKVKGTPLSVGAASVLRTATAFAACEETVEDTVHTAEDSIEKPKITVRA